MFSGVESFPLKECGWSSGWVKDCFGAGVLNSIGSKVCELSVAVDVHSIRI